MIKTPIKRKAEIIKGAPPLEFPNFNDKKVEQFFLKEMEYSEILLNLGDIENGAIHYSLAVAACKNQQSLLAVLEMTLSESNYTLLIQNLEQIKKEIQDHKQGVEKMDQARIKSEGAKVENKEMSRAEGKAEEESEANSKAETLQKYKLKAEAEVKVKAEVKVMAETG